MASLSALFTMYTQSTGSAEAGNHQPPNFDSSPRSWPYGQTIAPAASSQIHATPPSSKIVTESSIS